MDIYYLIWTEVHSVYNVKRHKWNKQNFKRNKKDKLYSTWGKLLNMVRKKHTSAKCIWICWLTLSLWNALQCCSPCLPSSGCKGHKTDITQYDVKDIQQSISFLKHGRSKRITINILAAQYTFIHK